MSKTKCNKKKLDLIEAMFIIAKAQSNTQKNFNRQEIRYYFCKHCKAYHTTKQKEKKTRSL